MRRKERMFPRVYTRHTNRYGKGIRPFENIEVENLHPKPVEKIKEVASSETQESSLHTDTNFSLISNTFRQRVSTLLPFFNRVEIKFFKPNCSPKKQTS